MRATRSATSRTCLAVLTCVALVVAAEVRGWAQDEDFVPVTDAMLQDPDPADWLMWRRTLDRTFAHMYETGGMRRVWVRGHENVRKRVLLQAAACGRHQHRAAPAPADRRRYAPEPAGAGCFGDLPPDRVFDRPLGASDARLGVRMDTGDARWLNRSSPSCLNSGTQRTGETSSTG